MQKSDLHIYINQKGHVFIKYHYKYRKSLFIQRTRNYCTNLFIIVADTTIFHSCLHICRFKMICTPLFPVSERKSRIKNVTRVKSSMNTYTRTHKLINQWLFAARTHTQSFVYKHTSDMYSKGIIKIILFKETPCKKLGAIFLLIIYTCFHIRNELTVIYVSFTSLPTATCI